MRATADDGQESLDEDKDGALSNKDLEELKHSDEGDESEEMDLNDETEDNSSVLIFFSISCNK